MLTAQTTYAAYLLSNGRYSVLLGPSGGGCSLFDGYALTRWAPDPTCDDDGTHIFIRDLESGDYWTAAAHHSHGCAVTTDSGAVRYAREVHGIETELAIVIGAQLHAELRRVTLRNATSRPRRLDVTTCAELALNTLAGDAAHPAFSRLFVQTEHVAQHAALLAQRRLRSPEDRPVFAVHALVGATAPTEFETDRARFIGRGRPRAVPAAMLDRAPLGGTVGSVLDPLFSLRTAVTLQPGEAVTLTAVLGGAATRADALHILDELATDDDVEAAFRASLAAGSTAAGGMLPDALQMPPAWREGVTLELPAFTAAPPVLHTHLEPGAAVQPDGHAAVQDDPETAVPGASRAGVTPGDRGSLEPGSDAASLLTLSESLRFFNGWGGFSDDGTEYVILLPREGDGVRRPPLPWVNVIANEDAGCIVTESGATHTWSGNSRENRVTPWSNDPVTDPHGEALFIRDDEAGRYWSPTPGPRPGAGDYEVRHGFGYTSFLHESDGLAQEVVVFVPVDLPARIARVRVTNRGRRSRRLSIWSYAQLVLGRHEADTRGRIATTFDGLTATILAVQPDREEFSGRVAFSRAVCDTEAVMGWTADRREFIGCGGSVAAPAALESGALAAAGGDGNDACAALSLAFTLAPGATFTCAFVLGEAADEAAAGLAVTRCGSMADVDAALAAARNAWAERVSSITIETPSPAIDLMVNGWLTYQNLGCRMWARTAFYQSGGAFGFRDQLQDSAALLYLDPALTRRQVLLHAAHQFVEGDVLHWWHPPLSKGIRTRFSDDLLWLPYITAFYIARTGDRRILDEDVRYIRGRSLEPGEDEEFLVPDLAGSSSLYEHCCRALDRSLTSGAHGLPLMGVGDWNDGMNRVGREGRGESVWLGFFLYDILRDFTGICAGRGDTARARRYGHFLVQLCAALNDAGWDGAWYRRAFYDNGEPLGSADSDECRIDALAQSWAVLSAVAPADRAAQALDNMEAQLVSEGDGIIRLLAPAFDRTPNDPGYIKGYLPGVRENGGQYTHGVLWAVRALAEHGRCERAAQLLEMLSPVTHGGSPERAARYQVEPYVIAADVYGVAPHVGRGGWTWYTGSAGWMYRIALESVLGFELRDGTGVRLRPCIPAAWPGFRVRFRLPDGTSYRIAVERRDVGNSSLAVDDGPNLPAMDGALEFPIVRDGHEHHVRVELGPDVAPHYVPR
jgi:cellobiose phosphorylase